MPLLTLTLTFQLTAPDYGGRAAQRSVFFW